MDLGKFIFSTALIKKLGLNREAINTMVEAQKFYDRYSHPSHLTIASCLSFESPGEFYVGGSYDNGKKKAYDKEFGIRVSLAKNLPEIVGNIKSSLEKW